MWLTRPGRNVHAQRFGRSDGAGYEQLEHAKVSGGIVPQKRTCGGG